VRVFLADTSGWNISHEDASCGIHLKEDANKYFGSGPSNNPNAVSAYIPLVPGTHHIKFIVDGDMKLSKDLPTAVDFTNILVNYIEVSPEEVLPHGLEQHPDGTLKPSSETSKSLQQTPTQPRTVPPGVHPPQVLPPTPKVSPTTAPPTIPSAIPEPPPDGSKPVPIAPGPPKEYHNVIPQFLLDLDEEEKSARFKRANASLNSLPPPPTLPMFLSRSILNGATPMKDDSSVLIMPNHTVLNHLATSSIRSNVLATSATTRYKRKVRLTLKLKRQIRLNITLTYNFIQFLTTIMYKPTNESAD
jgi:hypothetical protein